MGIKNVLLAKHTLTVRLTYDRSGKERFISLCEKCDVTWPCLEAHRAAKERALCHNPERRPQYKTCLQTWEGRRTERLRADKAREKEEKIEDFVLA